jgi:glyoxylate/hydroxypyruvate reductase
MPVNILFAARATSWDEYQAPLTTALSDTGLDFDLGCGFPPEAVDYIVYAPNSSLQDFAPFTRLKAVLSLWAGVEDIANNRTLAAPLARMVDAGLTQGMTEWVTGHVLRHHLGMDTHITRQNGVWRKQIPPLAQDRRVTILGMGVLGRAAAQALAALGFAVTGWSRSAKSIAGLSTLHGPDGLAAALTRAEIAVLLLPDTMATKNILNAATLARMPRGAVIINPGRGSLIHDADLLKALDSGQICHATLDVFRHEPLPPEHPFWAHPAVTVTPHIASETRPDSSSRVIAANVLRGETGAPFLHLVDRQSGY